MEGGLASLQSALNKNRGVMSHYESISGFGGNLSEGSGRLRIKPSDPLASSSTGSLRWARLSSRILKRC